MFSKYIVDVIAKNKPLWYNHQYKGTPHLLSIQRAAWPKPMTQLKLVTLPPGKVNFLLRLVHFICYSSTFYNVVTRIDESKTCIVDVSIEIDFNADSQSKYPWIVVQL